MEYKVFIFSDSIVKGQAQFDFEKFNNICAYKLINISQFIIENFDLEKSFLENNKDLIIFCDNNNLDNLIIKNIENLSGQKKIIDEQVVVFKKEEHMIVFVPIEADLYILNKVFENQPDLTYCQYKVFGLSKNTIIEKLELLKNDIPYFEYKILYDNLICDIFISYKNEELSLIDENKMKIVSAFNNNIFSENSFSLCKIIYSLLSQRNKSISIYENITKGKIVSSLLDENEDLINYIKDVKIKSFQCDSDDELVETTLKYLKDTGSDVVLITNGKFVENGLNFKFSIADKNEVHIFNSNFKADKNKCIEMAKNSALFHLMKKLRQNNFAF